MTDRMSRRAILSALAASPLVAAAGFSRAEVEDTPIKALHATIPQRFRQEMSEALLLAKPIWEATNNDTPWNTVKTDYEAFATAFWSYLLFGVRFEKERRDAKNGTETPLDVKAGVLKKAVKVPFDPLTGAPAGTGVAICANWTNLQDPKVAKRTEVCAFRTGRSAARLAIKENANATEVRLVHYSQAWTKVSKDLDELFDRAQNLEIAWSNRHAGGC